MMYSGGNFIDHTGYCILELPLPQVIFQRNDSICAKAKAHMHTVQSTSHYFRIISMLFEIHNE